MRVQAVTPARWALEKVLAAWAHGGQAPVNAFERWVFFVLSHFGSPVALAMAVFADSSASVMC